MNAADDAFRPDRAERHGADGTPPLVYPQSSGPDGLERLTRAWASPARTKLFTEPNNTWIGLLFFEAAERLNRRESRLAASLCLIAAASLAAMALVIGWTWPGSLSIDPTRHSYGAAVWTLLGWAAVHVASGAAMALWCLARLVLGRLDAWRCLTLRICRLWWRFTVPATALVLLLVVGFPYAFR